MLIVPLRAVPNQTLAVSLSSQNCQLNVYQTSFGLFMDVLSDGALVVAGQICQNKNRIVRYRYLGFKGDFAFVDLQAGGGEGSDPVYTGLGDRYQLVYIEPSDIVEA